MNKIDQLAQRMLSSLDEAERLLSNCPPDFHREEYHSAWRLVAGDCAEACHEAFEELGPVRSLSVCLDFMQDYQRQFQLLNPTDTSYSKALGHAKRYIRLAQGGLRELIAHKAPDDPSSNGRYLGTGKGPLRSTSHCYPVPDYDTPGSHSFQGAIWALMWCIQDVHETGGTPFGGIQQVAGGGMEIGWSWYCVRSQPSCVGNTIWAWVEAKWDELHRSQPDLKQGAMLLYPSVTEIWLGKWRYVAELIQHENKRQKEQA